MRDASLKESQIERVKKSMQHASGGLPEDPDQVEKNNVSKTHVLDQLLATNR